MHCWCMYDYEVIALETANVIATFPMADEVHAWLESAGEVDLPWLLISAFDASGDHEDWTGPEFVQLTAGPHARGGNDA